MTLNTNNIDYRLYHNADGHVQYYSISSDFADNHVTQKNYISITQEQYAAARSDVRVVDGSIVPIPKEQPIIFVPPIKQEIPPPKPIIWNNKKIVEIKNQHKVVQLKWIVNNICTNHCLYCPSILHSGTNHHYEWHHAEKFINDFFDRFSNVACNLSGGEPTVSPFFKQLINLMYDRGGKILLTSNLVRSIDWWKDIKEKFSSISTSYHPEFMDEKKEDEFIEKLIFLQEYTSTHVRVMMLPTHWDQCYKFYNRVKKLIEDGKLLNGLEMVRILPNYGNGPNFCEINYTKEQLEIILNSPEFYIPRKQMPPAKTYRTVQWRNSLLFDDGSEANMTPIIVNDLINNMNTDFRGWECDIGIESVFVQFNGDVKVNGCLVGGPQQGSIGSIITGIEWPTKTTICPKEHCHCPPDVWISKRIP